MNKMTVKDLTYGAIISAIYAILVSLSRFSVSAYDSISLYFVSIPIAIYSYQKGALKGLVVLMTMVALAFLIHVHFIDALVISLPNLVLGYVFGILKNKIKNLFTILITVTISIIASYLSLISLFVVSGITVNEYFGSDLSFIAKIFNIDSSVFTGLVNILIPVVLVFDGIMKTVVLYVVFIIIVLYLKIDQELNYKLTFIPSKIVASLSIVFVILSGVGISHCLLYPNYSPFIKVLLTIIIVIYIILMLYQSLLFISYIGRIILLHSGRAMSILVMFIMILLLPISYLGSLIYTLFYEKFPLY